MRALIVDGSRSLSTDLNKILSRLNISTEAHTSGNRALRSLSQTPADFVCISTQLSDMDAVTFAQRLNNVIENLTDNLILIGDMQNRELLSACTAAGIHYIFDPHNIEPLIDHIHDRVQQHRLDQDEGVILMVDHMTQRSQTLSNNLENFGYKVDRTSNAIEALKSMQVCHYDLIICDHLLDKGFSGLDLIQAVRSKQEHYLETPILVLTDTQDSSDCLELLNSGANDYLRRSTHTQECIARIGNLVKTKQLYDQVKYQRSRLMDMAMTDQLTRVFNRHYLFEVAPQKISESSRHGFALSLILVDLDYFKRINDDYGHSAGDTVLSCVGKLLKQSTRNEDVVGRFGGEEFVILLTHCNLEQARQKAEKIRQAIRELKPDNITVTASLGVAAFDKNEDLNFSGLFNRADAAVYLAKTNGRDRVETNVPGLINQVVG